MIEIQTCLCLSTCTQYVYRKHFPDLTQRVLLNYKCSGESKISSQMHILYRVCIFNTCGRLLGTTHAQSMGNITESLLELWKGCYLLQKIIKNVEFSLRAQHCQQNIKIQEIYIYKSIPVILQTFGIGHIHNIFYADLISPKHLLVSV